MLYKLFNALKIILTSLIAALACTGIIYATTNIGANISTTGTLTAYGNTTLKNLTATGTLSVTGLTTMATTTLAGNLTVTGQILDGLSGSSSGRLKLYESLTDTGHGWNPLTSTNITGESGVVELRMNADINTTQTSSENSKKMAVVGNYTTYDIEGDVLNAKGVDLYRTKAFRSQSSDKGELGVIYGHNMAIGHDTGNALFTGGIIGYAFTPFLGGGSGKEVTAFTIERDHAPHGIDSGAHPVTHLGKCDQTKPSPWDTYGEWKTYELCTATGYCTIGGNLDESYTDSASCAGAGGTWNSKTAGNWTEIPPQGFANWFEWSRNYMYGQYLFGNYWGRYGNGVADEYSSGNDQVEFGFSDQVDNHSISNCYVYVDAATPSSHYIDVLTDDANLNGKVIYLWATSSGGTENHETVTITGTTQSAQESQLITDINALSSGCYSASASSGKVAISAAGGCTIRAIAIDYSDSQITTSNIDIPHYPYVAYGNGNCDFYNVMTIHEKDAVRIGRTGLSTKHYDDDLYATHITTAEWVPQVNGLDLLFLDSAVSSNAASQNTYGDTSTYDTKLYVSKTYKFLVQDNSGTEFIVVNNHGNIKLAGSGNGSVTIGSHSTSPMPSGADGDLLLGDNLYLNGLSSDNKTIYFTRDGSSTDRARMFFTDSATGDAIVLRHDQGNYGTFAFDKDGNFSLDITFTPKLTGATRNLTAREGTPPTAWDGAGNTSRASLWVDDTNPLGAGERDGTATWHFTNEQNINSTNFRMTGSFVKTTTGDPATTNYEQGDICINIIDGTIKMLTEDLNSKQWVQIGSWTP
jgi:hypothetical protein